MHKVLERFDTIDRITLAIADSKYLYETEDYIQTDKYLNPITVEVMDNQYKTLATDEKC